MGAGQVAVGDVLVAVDGHAVHLKSIEVSRSRSLFRSLARSLSCARSVSHFVQSPSLALSRFERGSGDTCFPYLDQEQEREPKGESEPNGVGVQEGGKARSEREEATTSPHLPADALLYPPPPSLPPVHRR